MKCISTNSFSILVNEIPRESFKPERDMRQGDPISPILLSFVLNILINISILQQIPKHGIDGKVLEMAK